MDMPEVLISPDRQTIAIRTENAPDAWNAWFIGHRRNGGGFVGAAAVDGWDPLHLNESSDTTGGTTP